MGIFLLGGGTSGSVVCLGFVVHSGGDDKDIIYNPCRIPKADRVEEITENHVWDVGNTGFWRGVEYGWDSDISHICLPRAEDRWISGWI